MKRSSTTEMTDAASSQCQICATPMDGVLGFMFGIAGIRRSSNNPNICNRCNTHITDGQIVELTVVFADLSSFTKLTQELGPDRVHEVTDAFLRMATDALVARGAFIDKYIGDAVMAFFNVPIAHADHRSRAVAAAIDIQTELPNLGERFGLELRASVGIASGFARVGRLGSASRSDYTAIGDVVNQGARLQSQADAGEVLVDAAVYAEVRNTFPNVPAEHLHLKGFANPVQAFRLNPKTGIQRVRSADTNERRVFGPGSIIFAVLGAPCAAAVLIGQLSVAVGFGAVIGATSSFWFIDSPFLRWPMWVASLGAAAVNFYTVWHARLLRRQSSVRLPMTRLERRRTAFILTTGAFAIFVLIFEIYAHVYLMQHTWP